MSTEAPTNIIVSCTERKRAIVPERLHLGSLADGEPSARAREWWSRLAAYQGARWPANDLYCGEHWTLARRSLEALTSAGHAAQLWVASAGYGLIPACAPLCPYSATFAQGAPDSVTRGNVDRGARFGLLQAWWACLCRFPGPMVRECRSLRALAVRSPNSGLIVVASPDYIRAMRTDLLAAREVLKRPDRLIVISNHGLLNDVELSLHLIPVDGRCRGALGGTMQGLNARVALSMIEWGHNGPLTVPRLRRRYEDIVSGAARSPKPNRERTDDKDVLAFLRAELVRDPRAGWTPLLRALRGGGRACEQGRFKALHQRVRDEVARPPGVDLAGTVSEPR
jgi:hypothetical protein